MEGLNILDLECLQIEIVQSENSDGVLELETKHKGLQEIGSLLNSTYIFGCLRGLKGLY